MTGPADSTGRIRALWLHYRYLVLLIAVQLVFQLIVYKSGFAGASGDDFFRALMAFEWSDSPYFVSTEFGLDSVLWFPTHFWITGSIYILLKDLILSLTLTSCVSSIIELVLLFLLARALFDHATGHVVLLLVGFLPWQIWLGLSMTEMTLYFASALGAFLYLVKWQSGGEGSHVVTAGCFLLFATMLRPESWTFAAFFSAYLLIRFIRNPRSPGRSRAELLAMVIPCLFIIFWFGRNYHDYGHPMYFLMASKEHIDAYLGVKNLPLWSTILQHPFLMFIISPLIFLLAWTSILLNFRRLKSTHKIYLCFVLGQLLIIVAASSFGINTKAAPQRYVMINMLLLAPFAASFLSSLWRKRSWRAAVLAVLCIHLLVCGIKAFFYPLTFRDSIAIGKSLKEGFESGEILDSEQILSDVSLRVITGNPFTNETEYLQLTCAHVAMSVYSAKPRNFVINIQKVGDSDLLMNPRDQVEQAGDTPDSLDHSKLESRLRELNIRRIILTNRELTSYVPRDFRLIETVGTYLLFSKDTHPQSFPERETEEMDKIRAINEPLNEKVRLAGYGYRGKVFPDGLILQWKLERDIENIGSYMVKLTFINVEDREKRFNRTAVPVFHWISKGMPGESILVNDVFPLSLPPGLPAGDYSAQISLVDNAHLDTKGNAQIDDTKRIITLAPVTLISSKREVLFDFLKGRNRDFILLGKVLLTL
ncbi:hypothetical protein ACFLU6_00115 [Acidobacteriota bacterium]